MIAEYDDDDHGEKSPMVSLAALSDWLPKKDSPAKLPQLTTFNEQIAIMEKILCLRPYNIDLVTANTILGELESKIDDSFTLADLITFADGIEEYVVKRWNDHGSKLVLSRHHWHGSLTFHKELEGLCDELHWSVKQRLKDGEPIGQIIETLEAQMIEGNRRLCTKPSTFAFE